MLIARQPVFQITETTVVTTVPPTQNQAAVLPAPVVSTKTAVTLADHLDLHNLPLATTPAGKNFAIKCLHPAESTIKNNRAPGSLVPSVSLACDMVRTIPFPVGATSCCIMQSPNLMIPMSLVFSDSSGNYVEHWIFSNAALGGDMYKSPGVYAVLTPLKKIYSSIDSYRVTAQSITCDVIAPAVADQGTVISAQLVDKPQTLQLTTYPYNSGTRPAVFHKTVDVRYYDTVPRQEQLMMATSAYTGQARAGFYQPLKLDKFKFVSVDDPCVYIGPQAGTSSDVISEPVATVWGNYPIYCDSVGAGAAFNVADPPIVKPSGDVIGITYIDATAGNPQVSLRFRLRQVAEVIPCLGEAYAPLAEAPLPPDDLSFKMVREIGARMKDAYPASYNDAGKLKDTIVKIGRGILKFADPALDMVSLIPGIGTAAGAIKAGKGLIQAVNTIANPAVRNASRPLPPLPTPPKPTRPAPKLKSRKRRRGRRSG